MKQHIRNLAVGLVALLSVAAVQAQTKLAANVPFAFQAGNGHMATGRYLVVAGPGSIKVLGTESSVIALPAVRDDKRSSERKACKLVFRREGGNIYLAEIWSPMLDYVPKFRAPKRKTAIEARNAAPGTDSEEIVVWATVSR